MGFTLQLKRGVVVITGKSKPVKEGLLQGKFGGKEQYGKVKAAMETANTSLANAKCHTV